MRLFFLCAAAAIAALASPECGYDEEVAAPLASRYVILDFGQTSAQGPASAMTYLGGPNGNESRLIIMFYGPTFGVAKYDISNASNPVLLSDDVESTLPTRQRYVAASAFVEQPDVSSDFDMYIPYLLVKKNQYDLAFLRSFRIFSEFLSNGLDEELANTQGWRNFFASVAGSARTLLYALTLFDYGDSANAVQSQIYEAPFTGFSTSIGPSQTISGNLSAERYPNLVAWDDVQSFLFWSFNGSDTILCAKSSSISTAQQVPDLSTITLSSNLTQHDLLFFEVRPIPLNISANGVGILFTYSGNSSNFTMRVYTYDSACSFTERTGAAGAANLTAARAPFWLAVLDNNLTPTFLPGGAFVSSQNVGGVVQSLFYNQAEAQTRMYRQYNFTDIGNIEEICHQRLYSAGDRLQFAVRHPFDEDVIYARSDSDMTSPNFSFQLGGVAFRAFRRTSK